MAGTSVEFLAFALFVILVSNLPRLGAYREPMLLVASLLFLLSFSHSAVAFLPLAGFLAAGYVAVESVRRKPETAFVPALAAVLLLFVWLKKYGFVPETLWLAAPYVTIGLSYILFRLLHLVIETRYGGLSGRIAPVSYLAYLLNFTTLVAGPIQRYEEFAEQGRAAGKGWPEAATVAAAVERIVLGLFKSTVLAGVLSQTWTLARDRVLGGCTVEGSFADAVAAFAIYPFFLYCNFSGYIDIVVGMAALMRRKLPENFNRPFAAASVIDFWSRWHMTLSSWLKTYVYTPLLMSLGRRFPARGLESTWAVLAFFITFFLVGVWHGQTSEFAFFGLLTGLGMSVNKMHQLLMQRALTRKRYGRLSKQPLYQALGRGLTVSWFAFTLVWFWGSWSMVQQFINVLGARQLLLAWLAIFAGVTAVLWAWESVREHLIQALWQRLPGGGAFAMRAAWALALAASVAGVTLVSSQPVPEMVYKAF